MNKVAGARVASGNGACGSIADSHATKAVGGDVTLPKMPKPPWLDVARATATSPERQLWQALEDVEDPEWPVSVVDMGLIYSLKLNERKVDLKLTFTSMACPCMEFIIGDVRERLMKEASVDSVAMEVVWDPPWTRRRLTEKGLDRLRSWGLTV